MLITRRRRYSDATRFRRHPQPHAKAEAGGFECEGCTELLALRAHHPETEPAVRSRIKPLGQPHAIVGHFDQEGIRGISPAVDSNLSRNAGGMGVLDRIVYGLANDER